MAEEGELLDPAEVSVHSILPHHSEFEVPDPVASGEEDSVSAERSPRPAFRSVSHPPRPPQDLDPEESVDEQDGSDEEYPHMMASAISHRHGSHPPNRRMVSETREPIPNRSLSSRGPERPSRPAPPRAPPNDLNSASESENTDEEDATDSSLSTSAPKRLRSGERRDASREPDLSGIPAPLSTSMRNMKFGQYFAHQLQSGRSSSSVSRDGVEKSPTHYGSSKRVKVSPSSSRADMAPDQYIIGSSEIVPPMNPYNSVLSRAGSVPSMGSSTQNNPFEIAKRLLPVSLNRRDDWIMQIEKEHMDLGCPPCFRCVFKNKQSKHSTLFQMLETKFNVEVESMHSMEEYVDMIFQFHQDNFMPIFEKNPKITHKNQFVFSRFNIFTCCKKSMDNVRRKTYLRIHDIETMIEQIYEHHLNQLDPVTNRLYMDDTYITQMDKLTKLQQSLYKGLQKQGSASSGFGA